MVAQINNGKKFNFSEGKWDDDIARLDSFELFDFLDCEHKQARANNAAKLGFCPRKKTRGPMKFITPEKSSEPIEEWEREAIKALFGTDTM